MPKQQKKNGGNIAKNLSDLMVPFGLILAKDSLESFLSKQKAPATATRKIKKVSLSGGSGCSASVDTVEGYTRPSRTTYATVGGGSKNVSSPKLKNSMSAKQKQKQNK